MIPKVSIITATHYRPDFLRRCILSVQSQTFKDYEHLIISDHCPYAKGVCEDFDDKRIKYHEVETPHVFNHGSIAKNLGIKLAESDFICYCDDDNFLLPNHIDVLYKTINNNDYGMVSSLYGLHFEAIESYEKAISREIYDFSMVATFSHSDMLSTIHRRELIDDVVKWKTPGEINLVVSSENWALKHSFRGINCKTKYLAIFTCVYTGGRCSLFKKNDIPKRRFAAEYRQGLDNLPDGKKYLYPPKDYKKFDTSYAIENFRKINKYLLKFVSTKKEMDIYGNYR